MNPKNFIWKKICEQRGQAECYQCQTNTAVTSDRVMNQKSQLTKNDPNRLFQQLARNP